MMHRGFIKIHRKMLDWEWKTCPETVALFVHLLLNANFEDKKWRGIDVKRGQIVAGRASLAEKTGLSQRSVRTSLKRLKTTNEVTIKTASKYSIITITNWDLYQPSDQQNDQQETNKRPASDQQETTPKECKELKELKEEKEYKKNNTKKDFIEKPDDVNEEVWDEYVRQRKKKKALITQRIINSIRKDAAKVNWTLEEALGEITSRNWQGFNSDWVKPKPIQTKDWTKDYDFSR